MLIAAQVKNRGTEHEVIVRTADVAQTLTIGAKTPGRGSAVNGGELLLAALATCYCNDLYREAARLGVQIDAVEVEASAEFNGVGVAASNIRYRARLSSAAPAELLAQLLRETDAVAEVHNTIRAAIPVTLEP